MSLGISSRAARVARRLRMARPRLLDRIPDCDERIPAALSVYRFQRVEKSKIKREPDQEGGTCRSRGGGGKVGGNRGVDGRPTRAGVRIGGGAHLI